MPISTYAELKTAITNRLHGRALGAIVSDFIALGEARIYRDLRIRAMETALSTAISGGVVSVPSGYIEMKHAYINSNHKLTRKTAEWIYLNYPTRSSDGLPLFFSREADSFIFGPYPDSAYTMKGIYYKRLDALSDSNTTNWFTANAPDILLFAALIEVYDYLEDDTNYMKYVNKYNEAKDNLQRADRAEEFSGSILSVTAA